MARNNRPEGNPNQEANIVGFPEGEQQEAGRVLENSIQRIREKAKSEAPETNVWMENAKDTTVTVLKKVGGDLWRYSRPARGILLVVWNIVVESLEEIKEDFKEKIVNPLLKKIGAKPLKINKPEEKKDK